MENMNQRATELHHMLVSPRDRTDTLVVKEYADAKLMREWSELETAILERNHAIEERKAAFAERDTAFLLRDIAIAERDTAIMDRDWALAALERAWGHRNLHFNLLSERHPDLNRKEITTPAGLYSGFLQGPTRLLGGGIQGPQTSIGTMLMGAQHHHHLQMQSTEAMEREAEASERQISK